MPSDAMYYNALAIATESNHRRLRKLHTHYHSWEAAWEEERGKCSSIDPEAAWKKLEGEGVRLILEDDPEFPYLLKEIPWPPCGLYVRGTLSKKETRGIAIVGTRKASETSVALARRFAEELSKSDITIVSGLALGIDAAAHTGCLDSKGHTVAVLAQGLDRVYPRTNDRLAERILASGGALISEYPIGSPPLPYRFLERNRIVSGLSEGVIVIEAPVGSGSLATARFALEQNREVFVVPGPATHPHFAGSHDLIRNGATLVTASEHILEAFGIAPQTVEVVTPQNEEEKIILTLLKESVGPLTVDKIVELSKLKTQQVTQTLTFLVIRNAIKENEIGYSL